MLASALYIFMTRTEPRTMMIQKTHFRSTFLALALTALVGCGGGGGDSTPTPTPTPTPTESPAQGFWAGTLAGTASASAVIVDNGDAWIVFQDVVAGANTVTGFARAALTVSGTSFTGTGRHYKLTDNTVQSFTASGTLQGTTALQTTVVMGAQAPVGPAALAYNARYRTPAVQADASGQWRATFNAGASVVSILVGSTGSLSGSSTTGCTYVGSLVPRSATVAVYNLAFTETCVTGSSAMNGIGTLNEAKTGLSLAFTNADGAKGGLLLLQR